MRFYFMGMCHIGPKYNMLKDFYKRSQASMGNGKICEGCVVGTHDSLHFVFEIGFSRHLQSNKTILKLVGLLQGGKRKKQHAICIYISVEEARHVEFPKC